MKTNNFIINIKSYIRDALEKINLNKRGAVFIEDKDKIVGIITDGDARRALLKNIDINTRIIKIINKKFIFLTQENATRENILKLLNQKI